jgi:hypothetical protein
MVDVMENIPVGEITGAAARFWDPFLKFKSIAFLRRYKCDKA